MSIFSMYARTRARIAHACLLLCVLAAVCWMTGCASTPPVSSADVLDAMCQAATERPIGQVRVRSIPQADTNTNTKPSYLDDNVLSALYGAECLSWFDGQETQDGTQSTPIVDDVAIYLSTVQHPFEVAVFRCTDSYGTLSTAKQCKRRLHSIQETWNGTDKEAYCRLGCVEIVDNYVILVISDKPEALLDAARRLIS